MNNITLKQIVNFSFPVDTMKVIVIDYDLNIIDSVTLREAYTNTLYYDCVLDLIDWEANTIYVYAS